jgi:hypothetical protein
MIEDDPTQRWRECRLVDISAAGAGLELLDATPEETQGRRITLALELKAEVRYTREGSDEELRVGIQFVELTDAECAYIAHLAELGTRC